MRGSLILMIFLILLTFNPSIEIVTAYEVDSHVSWELLTTGFGNKNNFATRGIGIYNNELYVGTQSFDKSKKDTLMSILAFFGSEGDIFQFLPYWYGLKSAGCEIWKYNKTASELQQVVGNLPEAKIEAGFGNSINSAAAFFIEFKDKLYVGTMNDPLNGCEVWTYGGDSWEQVVTNGFGDSNNYAAWSAEIFNGYLYIGTANWNNGKFGFCQIWRSPDGKNWNKVVDRGFRDFDDTERTHNRYVWSMAVYKDYLYVGTYNHPALLGHKGCQLWRTFDGENWLDVKLPGGDGFGEATNYGIRNLEVYNDWLYVGTAGSRHGFEIWKYNGITWIPVISDEVPGIKFRPWHIRNDGFGDKGNGYVFSMFVSSNNDLWIGTGNNVGCELYRFDGILWKQIVGDDEISEAPNGFGISDNNGARSMLEYPQGSGNIVVGTSTSFARPNTCQVWMRESE